jgi:uncharacterized RDD family membrane protein YckC
MRMGEHDFERQYQAARRKEEELADLDYVERTEGQQAREAMQKAWKARTAEPYASWRRRVLARLADTVLVVAIVAGTAAIAAATGGDWRATAGIAYLLVAVLYFPLFHAYASGQTPGKGLLGIAVHRTQGSLGFGRALWRWLVEGLIGIIPLVDYLWPLWDGRNQSLHDKAAGTVVIRTAGL